MGGEKPDGLHDVASRAGAVERLALHGPPFSILANEIGGEDDLLFHRLQSEGYRFGWAAHALVDEVVPAHRATIEYAYRRAFAYGQGPSQACANASPPNWLGVAGWMGVGTGQLIGYGLAGLCTLPFNAARAVSLGDRAVQGLGKLLWAPIFEPKFYGRALLNRENTAGN